MSTSYGIANVMLDQWAELWVRQTEETPESVFDETGRQALVSYLVDTDGHGDTADLCADSPGGADRFEWAEALVGLRVALEELTERTADSTHDGTHALVRGLAQEQLQRESVFGRFMAGQLLDEEAHA